MLLPLHPTWAREGAERHPLVPGLCPALALGKMVNLKKQEEESDGQGSGSHGSFFVPQRGVWR